MSANQPQRPARTVLEQRLRDEDRTYDESAAWFEQVAISLGERCTITARHLRRLASGERQGASPATRRVLQAMFGIPAAELLAKPADGAELEPTSRVAITEPLALTEREVLLMAAARARRFTLANSSNLTGESMDQLHDDVAHIATIYQQQPSAQFLPALVDIQDELFTLLEGRQPPAHTRHLLLLAGVASGILAKVSHDLADPHAALTQARTAYLCADNAGHNGMRAWIRGLQSLIAYWAGRPHDAIRYAQQGATFTTHGTVSAWLPVSEARAWAALGNDTAALDAIGRATSAREQVTPDDIDELGGLCTFSHARQQYYAADALAWLPTQARLAQQHASVAVASYANPTAPGWAYSDAAGAATNLATARIASNDLDGAAAALESVFTLPPEQRINGVVASVQRVRNALATKGACQMGTTLQERIEAFTALPASAILTR